MGVPLPRRLFTVDEYHLMAQAGVLSEDERVELVEGEVVLMTPIGSRHAACVKRLNRLFSARAGAKVVVGVQDPVRLGAYSEPQPDVALLKPRADFYASAHPGPEDVLLVVEVAESSAAYDLEVKIPLYARAGIPEVWLVDLDAGEIRVYREPAAGRYRQAVTVSRGGEIAPAALPEVVLAADEVLG